MSPSTQQSTVVYSLNSEKNVNKMDHVGPNRTTWSFLRDHVGPKNRGPRGPKNLFFHQGGLFKAHVVLFTKNEELVSMKKAIDGPFWAHVVLFEGPRGPFCKFKNKKYLVISTMTKTSIFIKIDNFEP